MQAIEFYCKKCRKSMRISYALTRDRNGSGYERHHDKMPYPQMYQSSDP